ncbi:hypothetical protein JL720_666 [Aureococcus anophagefferens]|nr:hypothetical protein JL720_666 [Aureococcus anophagefferens]
MDLRARVALAATIILFLIFTSDDVLVPLFGERFPPFHRNDVTFLVGEAAAGVETSELDRRHAALIKEKIHAVTFGQFTKYMTRDNVTNHHVRCDDDIVTARGFKWFHMQGGICPYGEGKYCGQNPAVDRVFRDWLRKHEVRIIMLERHGLAKYVSGLLKTNQTLPKHCETAACVARVGEPHETNPHLLVKSIQRPLDEIIANYAEVEAALVGTPWEVPERRRVF